MKQMNLFSDTGILCRKCNTVKQKDDFYPSQIKAASKRDGSCRKCKECQKALNRKRYRVKRRCASRWIGEYEIGSFSRIPGIEGILCRKCHRVKQKDDFDPASISKMRKSDNSCCRCKQCNTDYYLERKNSGEELYNKFDESLTKKCGGCKKSLTLDKFNRCVNGKYGRHTKCKECLSSLASQWYQDNKERRRKYKKNHLPSKLRKKLGNRVQEVMKKIKADKAGGTVELLGCDIHFFKTHIEKQFKEGMSWENHGIDGWHLDHIRPCASFDLTDPEQQKECFHYSNLQPLWAKENMNKSSRWNGKDWSRGKGR